MDFEGRKIARHPRGFSDNHTAPADVMWGACLVLEVSPAEEQNAATAAFFPIGIAVIPARRPRKTQFTRGWPATRRGH